MTSVVLLKPQLGRRAVPVGEIDFYLLPVHKEADFRMVPPSMVSFADVQSISIELMGNVVHGTVGRYEWRKPTCYGGQGAC